MDALALLTDGMVSNPTSGDSQIIVVNELVGEIQEKETLEGVIDDES